MSKLEVDAIEPQSGTTITIGASGDTVNLVGTLNSNGSPLPGDISSVVAGTGLSGGGTTGAVTLNIEAAQPTITSLGTITGFTSTGIDDNADSSVITLTNAEDMLVGTGTDRTSNLSQSSGNLQIENGLIFESGSSSTNNEIMTYRSNSLVFGTGASERMRLNSTGLGIGVSSPSRKLQVVQDSTSAGGIYLYSNAVHTGTDTNALLAVRSDSNNGSNNGDVVNIQGDGVGDLLVLNNNGTDRVTVQADGKVGIGTGSPGVTLDVNSSTQTTLLHLNSTAGTSSAITFANTGSNDSIAISAESDNLKLRTDDGNILFAVAENSEKMRISSAGKVSIGNTNASSFGSLATDLVIGTTSGEHGLTIVTGTGNSARMQFSDNTSSPFVGAIEYSHSSNALMFYADGSQKMKITSAGRVGIGTSNPNENLHISDTASNKPQIRLETSDSGSKRLDLYVDGSIGTIASDQSAQSLAFRTSNSERMRIDSSGNVGIGVASPGSNAVNISVADTRVTSGRVLDVHHTKTDSTFNGIVGRFQSGRNTTNGTYEFIRCAISGVANKFIVTDGGTIQAVNTTVASISDERIKQDIVDAKSQWNDIKALKFKNFKKKQAVRDDGDNALKELGVIAQDVESAGMNGLIEMSNPDISSIKSDSSFGTLWTEDDEEVKNGTETVGEVKEIKEKVKTVKYSMIWMKSVKALQEAMERIESLEAEVTALKNQQQ